MLQKSVIPNFYLYYVDIKTFIKFNRQKDRLPLALLKVSLRGKWQTLSFYMLLTSDFLLIKNVAKYLLILCFFLACDCCGQKHSDIDLILEMPCPKASNQQRAVSLNSPRNSPVIGAWCKKCQQEIESSGKATYYISTHQRIIF